VDDDDPMKAAGREIAAAARAVATGVAVAARAKVERQAERRFEEARRLQVRGRADSAWTGVERREQRLYDGGPVGLAERERQQGSEVGRG
jgi:hypothetical protein